MRVDEKLNLVIPLYDGEQPYAYAHSMPIGREVFDRYYMVIAKTFSSIYGEGLGSIAAPRIAANLLRDRAKEMGILDGPDGVQTGLIGEIRRLTNVILPGDDGWTPIPLADAERMAKITSDDVAEVMNAAAFFIVASAMHRRNELSGILGGAARLWSAQVSSLNCTEYAATLPKSTPGGNSTATAA